MRIHSTLVLLSAVALLSACHPDGDGNAAFDQDGVSLAVFSVSPDRQVRFSRGNLQYQPSTGQWRLAEAQYHYADEANGSIAPDAAVWIDLFGWGTSGWNSGAVAYQPYCTSTDYYDYYPGTSHTNSLEGHFEQADWGRYNSVGGTPRGFWRTLTAREWAYLLEQRPMAEAKRGVATIVGVCSGLVILPDNWRQPDNIVFNTSLTAVFDDYSANYYTTGQWGQMEQAGAIFLPAAGCRVGTALYSMGQGGDYWSATAGGDRTAYALSFFGHRVVPDAQEDRSKGFSVRLVTD